MTREQKLEIVASNDLGSVEWQTIAPNEHGDWVNQRNDEFTTWPAIGDKATPAVLRVFANHSQGINSGRDAWVYNFSSSAVLENMRKSIDYYNVEVERAVRGDTDRGSSDQQPAIKPNLISWTTNSKKDFARRVRYRFRSEAIQVGDYRPFCRQAVYFDRTLLERVYQLPTMFPTASLQNTGIWLSDRSAAAPFNTLMTTAMPNLTLGGAGNPGQSSSPVGPTRRQIPTTAPLFSLLGLVRQTSMATAVSTTSPTAS